MFLGCSWTWCIGMFLPVLLVRDLGLWGWVAFAIPNVVGAAAMGWVLRTRDASLRIVQSHAAACRAFSAVTIAFHVFFVLWFVPRLVGLPASACTFALAAVYLLATVRRLTLDTIVAAIVWIISLVLFGLFLTRHSPVHIPMDGDLSPINTLWLTPVCIFGFLLCPYLDLTFHRARQETSDRGARIAFGVGFGICFLAMIVFSLCYATALKPLLSPQWRQHLRPAFGAIITTHMILQTAFTLAAHTRSVVYSKISPGGILALLVLSQLALLLGLAGNLLPRQFGLDFGELIYRLFMAFYGLLFPAYVWICMVPRRQSRGAL
ncbi:MAG TPA: hypothetical protein VN541_08330, partial [Tepidisphaeraceae bacterium]|nr:hypothetical protein [Tepidisphaeraceae bacterium]